ncbi:hypothetical protein Sango_1609800 [Sesamum angolense]|uniref:SWIM-type domain-containing protein n=1 Tax=Sesamum angolense TaxID=2727404 RepID=A0AAE1WJF9_9LAMI|nr:hypothetical protein Sango_1609800 [Sesamum angolense]
MNETLTETVTEKLSENVPEMNENLGRDKGKRKLYERFLNESSSEFDHSSDEDYVQSNSETDSDTQSLVLEDVEAESDDDIFLNKNPSKRDLIKKLKRVMKDKNKTVMTEQMPETGDGDWPSDIGDEKILLVYQTNHRVRWLFFKNLLWGQLLVAVGRDGNDNMFPIAMAVVQSENRETWSWFVGELLDDIGGLGTSKWSFISDRQKGLIEALKDLVPDSEHRFCIRHMYQNFKLKFKSEELKEYFWKAASTANRKDFEKYMKKIEEINPKISDDVETASDWLKKISPEHWARSFFPVHSKYDILVNNLCESFNNYILEARDKPIISMFEWIRTKLMSRLQQKMDGMEKYSGSICPNVKKKINKQQSQARHCFTRWCGGSEFEVDHFLDKFVVDLEKKTCTCGMFQLTGLPCCHACAAIGSKRSKLEDYVDDCYTKSTYLKVYSEKIHAVPGAKDYITTSFEPFKPPHMKKKRGRPNKLRRKGPDELQSTSTRKGLTHTCSKCLKTGHNKESCKNPIHPKSKFFKESIPKEISQGSQAPPMSQEPAGESTNFISKQQKESGQQFASSTKSVEQMGYQGPRNAALLGKNRTYQKRPTISEVLDKIKERSKRRQQK